MKLTPSAILARVRKMEDSANIAAWVILKDGEHVGTARIKYPRDGAARLTVALADWTLARPEDVDFVNFSRWQIGAASGYGYDKATAAFSGLKLCGHELQDSGWEWDRQLRDAGFALLRAI